jgi:hypothetical protein
MMTVSQPVCFGVRRPLWREDVPVVYSCCWSSPVQSLLGPSPTGLTTIFFSLNFKTLPTWKARSTFLYPSGTGRPSYSLGTGSLFVAWHDLQGYGGSIRSASTWWYSRPTRTRTIRLGFCSLSVGPTENTTFSISCIVACVSVLGVMWFFAVEMCLQSPCLATNIFWFCSSTFEWTCNTIKKQEKIHNIKRRNHLLSLHCGLIIVYFIFYCLYNLNLLLVLAITVSYICFTSIYYNYQNFLTLI